MISLSLAAIAAQTGGTLLHGDPAKRHQGVFTDTRAPRNGALFVALNGENFDGHDFLPAAAPHATAVLIAKSSALQTLRPYPSCGVILVPETRQAMLQLAAAYRESLPQPCWLAVTGSMGKSTVKEMLASILGAGAGWRVHWARKSFNNEIGVPLTLFEASDRDQAVVMELGTNHPGEIARLARIVQPRIAVLTNAGPCHLEGLGSLQGVAEEKGALLDFQAPGGTTILPAEDAFLSYWRARARGQVRTFGCSPQAETRAIDIRLLPGTGSVFQLLPGPGQKAVEIRLQVSGLHNVRNALAAAAAALAAGATLEAVAKGLACFSGVCRRFQVLEHHGITLIDDAYNANPESFRTAIESASAIANGKARLFIIAGDMLELGPRSGAYHRELGRQLAQATPYRLLTVGTLAAEAGQEALQSGLPARNWNVCSSPEDAASKLQRLWAPGDVVLIKGSHGIHLERCVKLLTAPQEDPRQERAPQGASSAA